MKMPKWPRINLFEFHELNWFPNFLKFQSTLILYIMWTFELPEAITDIFPFLKNWMTPRFKVVSNQLCSTISTLAKLYPDQEVIVMDMCSGGSGPNDLISRQVNQSLKGKVDKPVKFYLSDLYPNLTTWKRVCANNPYLNFISESVDATKPFNFPKSEKIFQTFYSCFHHFDDKNVRKILKNSLESTDGFAIIETTNRTFTNCFKGSIISDLFIMLVLPFYFHKVPLSMFVCVYIFPILMLTWSWDSLISCLRTRSNEELLEIIQEFNTDDWTFEAGYGYSNYPLDKVNWIIGYKTLEIGGRN